MQKQKPGPKLIMCDCGQHARIEDSEVKFFAEVCSKEEGFEHLNWNAIAASADLSLAESGIVRQLIQQSQLPETEAEAHLGLRAAVSAITAANLGVGEVVTPELVQKIIHRFHARPGKTNERKPKVAAAVVNRLRKKHRWK